MKGLAISPGYAVGQIYRLKQFKFEEQLPPPQETFSPQQEIEKVEMALELSRQEISRLLMLPQIKSSIEITSIFQAHLTLLDDPDLKEEIFKRISQQSQDAYTAISSVIQNYSNFFRNLPDPQFQGKAIDIMDVGKRLMKHCQGTPQMSGEPETNGGVIIVAEDLTPSEMASFEPANILGIAIEDGTPTSHAAIMARTLGIPTLIQVEGLMEKAREGAIAIIDSVSEQIIFEPDDELKIKYKNAIKAWQQRQAHIQEMAGEPSVSLDGVPIMLSANIGQLSDVDLALANKAESIGLFRTEFAYVGKQKLPTEEELFQAYATIAKRFGHGELTFRTCDIGGDKVSYALGDSLERNPELGWRAIRVTLDQKDMFKTQLRAILRLSGILLEGQIRLMFPMISNLTELRDAKALLHECHEELINEGLRAASHIKTGMMIETPAAALLAEKFAKEVEFFSIGSNDLTQYTLAVDRTNSKVSHLYQQTSPAVLKLIKYVIDVAKKANIDVSLCGELAGDSRFAPLLLGLGLESFSMNSILIPAVKHVVRNSDLYNLKKLVEPILAMDTAEEINQAVFRLNTKLGLQ